MFSTFKGPKPNPWGRCYSPWRQLIWVEFQLCHSPAESLRCAAESLNLSVLQSSQRKLGTVLQPTAMVFMGTE